ncbi:WYL domain-containing protein [Tenacibaculum finnmarkense]|uniref:WYL domain-containing protein n=1 Tax=Tenacibaculum finnmarkense TaxID=2781243 RepID=UPI00187B5EE3|nr:WYL domain-containing protein [Tenacibaculum finnmarkense]MBE7648785.1 WYL domain-containing protein [Tenacibaculum finnmarkense genomovar ulcerans]
MKNNISKKIQRQIAIINFLKIETKSSSDILNHLAFKGHSKSTSTLSNDIKSLKESGFKIDDNTKGYYTLFLDECNELFSHFVKYQSMAIAYEKALQIPEKNLQYILFEPNALEFNLEIFSTIFDAIITKVAVIFKHVNYKRNNAVKKYIFEPYVLKEFQNRWYVIGKTEKGYRTFSLDRISDLQLTKNKTAINLERIEEKLRYTVGVSFNEETIKPIQIKLKINNSQKEYIKTTPIFKYQKITEEHADFFILSLFVGNSIELHQKILKYGHRIEVLEPLSLREEIANEVKELMKNYNI